MQCFRNVYVSMLGYNTLIKLLSLRLHWAWPWYNVGR